MAANGGNNEGGGGFSGSSVVKSFGENFGTAFLENWKNRKFGSDGTYQGSDNPIQMGTMGGATIQPFGTSKSSSLYSWTPPQATVVQPGAPGGPGLGEQLASSAIGAGISAAVPLLFGCDERIKVDMAPLESTEVNDALAEVAFFVKGLRECA